jgi:hypothetical protein
MAQLDSKLDLAPGALSPVMQFDRISPTQNVLLNVRENSPKTGVLGLFVRMMPRMMQAEGAKYTQLDFTSMMSPLGRYYQVRDDYHDVLLQSVNLPPPTSYR